MATRAGVSHQTVSRVINGGAKVSEATLRRVRAAIDELGYRPNSLARALAHGRSQRIGVLVGNSDQHGPVSTMQGLERAARHHGYAPTTYSFRTPDELSAGVDFMLGQRVDGLAVITPHDAALAALDGADLPEATLLVGAGPRAASRLHRPSIQIDQSGGARVAVEHLIGLGHRRIAHLAGPEDWYDGHERRRQWAQTLTAAGLDATAVIEGDWRPDSGHAAAGKVLDAGVSAVFVANDQMALGLVHGLAEHGRSVPGDISIVGFDDLPESAHFLPPLTTVHQDFAALGEDAVRLLLGEDGGLDEGAPTDAERLRPWLVERESTRRLTAAD
ncbi:LacI family DNA-binding transcriptional regulator [Tersicoccus sp. MR15.9]|uniref:LacI family DNA-binding transcriptional regulator n=1 Tax=Tersicoccus mangrovi TaxID=3121635 RepID=UPI002FE594CD